MIQYVRIRCKFTYKLQPKVYKKAKILIFCTVFVGKSVFAQKMLPTDSIFRHFIPTSFPFSVKNLSKDLPISIPASSIYLSQLGFFCKQELKFAKATKIPLKWRLGSVEQCDRLEGKHQYR